MPQAPIPDFMPALPEIWLAGVAMLLLMIGAFRGNEGTRLVSWLAVLGIAVAFVFIVFGGQEDAVTFAGMFVVDSFSTLTKGLILIGAAAS